LVHQGEIVLKRSQYDFIYYGVILRSREIDIFLPFYGTTGGWTC
jgi:hypothetical protein